MAHDRKTVAGRTQRHQSLVPQLTKAIGSFEASQAHDAFDAFRALYEHKVSLLIAACSSLARGEYNTNDARESVVLLRYLLNSPRYSEIDIVICPRSGSGAFPNLGSLEDDLFSLSSTAALDGKGIRFIFVLDDWIQVLADEGSFAATKNLLVHQVQVALAPKEQAIGVQGETLVLFRAQKTPSCFLTCSMETNSPHGQLLTISYDSKQFTEYANRFECIWTLQSVRRTKLL